MDYLDSGTVTEVILIFCLHRGPDCAVGQMVA